MPENNDFARAISNVKINGRVFLAPMAGVTDYPFRSICKEMGAAVVYTEMVSAKGLFFGGKNTEKLLVSSESERPLAVQIFGREPAIMSEMAKALEQRGFELIDINMGCPAPKIVRNGEGSALMKEPPLIGEIVKAVSGAVSVPVTVKIRKGYDANSVNAVLCAKIAEENGAAAVAVHGRTRSQQYSGRADWSIIREVKEALSIPVIGNGDVVDGASAREMLDETRCDFIMIGRASCGNPWIFSETNHFLTFGKTPPCPSLAEKKDVIMRHLTSLVEYIGEYRAVLEMRRHLGSYVKGHAGASKLRSRINQIESVSEFMEVLSLI